VLWFRIFLNQLIALVIRVYVFEGIHLTLFSNSLDAAIFITDLDKLSLAIIVWLKAWAIHILQYVPINFCSHLNRSKVTLKNNQLDTFTKILSKSCQPLWTCKYWYLCSNGIKFAWRVKLKYHNTWWSLITMFSY